MQSCYVIPTRSISDRTLSILNAAFPDSAPLSAIPTLVDLTLSTEPNRVHDVSPLVNVAGAGGQRALARAVEGLGFVEQESTSLGGIDDPPPFIAGHKRKSR